LSRLRSEALQDREAAPREGRESGREGARGKHPKLSADCASALREAIAAAIDRVGA
jgi:hypothetical protein